MSYLTEAASLEFDPGSAGAGQNNNSSNSEFDYHLPHAKAIDLIGEEFVAKSRQSGSNVVVESISSVSSAVTSPIVSTSSHLGPNVVLVNTSSHSGAMPLVQQILQAQTQVIYEILLKWSRMGQNCRQMGQNCSKV